MITETQTCSIVLQLTAEQIAYHGDYSAGT